MAVSFKWIKHLSHPFFKFRASKLKRQLCGTVISHYKPSGVCNELVISENMLNDGVSDARFQDLDWYTIYILLNQFEVDIGKILVGFLFWEFYERVESQGLSITALSKFANSKAYFLVSARYRLRRKQETNDFHNLIFAAVFPKIIGKRARTRFWLHTKLSSLLTFFFPKHDLARSLRERSFFAVHIRKFGPHNRQA